MQRNGFTHKCNTVREGASESLQLEAYNSAKRASQGLRVIVKLKSVVLLKNTNTLILGYGYTENSIRRKTKQETTHLNTVGKCSLSKNCQFRRSRSKAAVW